MGEERKEVSTWEVAYRCDVCLLGFMFPLKEGQLRGGPEHIHACNNCKKRKVLDCLYPHIRYEKK